MTEDIDPARADAHERSIGRLEEVGGAQPGLAPSDPGHTVVGAIGDAEAANLRVRLVAIENILVAMLANSPDSQLDLIREMAAYISPRSGKTPHRLTVEAARNMLAIIARAEHYRTPG